MNEGILIKKDLFCKSFMSAYLENDYWFRLCETSIFMVLRDIHWKQFFGS